MNLNRTFSYKSAFSTLNNQSADERRLCFEFQNLHYPYRSRLQWKIVHLQQQSRPAHECPAIQIHLDHLVTIECHFWGTKIQQTCLAHRIWSQPIEWFRFSLYFVRYIMHVSDNWMRIFFTSVFGFYFFGDLKFKLLMCH